MISSAGPPSSVALPTTRLWNASTTTKKSPSSGTPPSTRRRTPRGLGLARRLRIRLRLERDDRPLIIFINVPRRAPRVRAPPPPRRETSITRRASRASAAGTRGSASEAPSDARSRPSAPRSPRVCSNRAEWRPARTRTRSRASAASSSSATSGARASFSDVYETRARRGRDENVRTFFADSASKSSAVIKCSVPFPGVVGGRRTLGDGLGVGECEAGALAAMPAHPRVVEMLAAFLSAGRNESYLLLADAGRCLHAARVEGEVTPLDARRHSRAVFEALAHCHAHGVVHRDVKAGERARLRAVGRLVGGVGGRLRGAHRLRGRKRPGVVDPEPPSRYGTPGCQAPELLMTDMRDAEADASGGRWFAVDIFALGCAMFPVRGEGAPLRGADRSISEDPLGAYGARTKTKARTQAEQKALEDAMGRGDTFEPLRRRVFRHFGSERRRARRRAAGSPPSTGATARPSAAAAAARTNLARRSISGAGSSRLAFLRALRRDVAYTAPWRRRSFGRRRRTRRCSARWRSSRGTNRGATRSWRSWREMLGKRAVPAPPPRGRETLERFVARKLGKRQPAAFCALVAACLARDPTRRPTARERSECARRVGRSSGRFRLRRGGGGWGGGGGGGGGAKERSARGGRLRARARRRIARGGRRSKTARAATPPTEPPRRAEIGDVRGRRLRKRTDANGLERCMWWGVSETEHRERWTRVRRASCIILSKVVYFRR